jgi:hypothetical protein
MTFVDSNLDLQKPYDSISCRGEQNKKGATGEWLRPTASSAVITSTAGQYAPQNLPKKVKDARKRKGERHKHGKINLVILSRGGDFYLQLIFE